MYNANVVDSVYIPKLYGAAVIYQEMVIITKFCGDLRLHVMGDLTH